MTPGISATVNRPYLPEGGGGITCEIEIEPDGLDGTTQRHIAICVDSSGSMAYSKMDQVRDATKLVYGLLNDDDYLSIVTFDSEVDVIMEATRWGSIDREDAEALLEEIDTGGGTDIYSGLETARKSLMDLGGDDDVSKRILLLSDGRDLRAKAPDFEPLAKAIKDGGISVYSAGIGGNYDKEIIQTVGEHSQGRWTHVTSPTDIRSFFGDVVQEASSVVANNPELVLEPVDGCEIGTAFRRLPQVQKIDLEYDGDAVVVGLPDLQDREEQQVVLKIDAPPRDVGTSESIVDVELDAGSETVSTSIDVTYTDDQEALSAHDSDITLAYHDTDLRTRIARADSAEAIEEVKSLIDETEVITGEKEIADALRENVTRIEQSDEDEIRKIQQDTTVVYDGREFE